jgi:hypothetical protein
VSFLAKSMQTIYHHMNGVSYVLIAGKHNVLRSDILIIHGVNEVQ